MTTPTKIMVIDGSEVARTIIERSLQGGMANAEIITCGSAKEALSHLSNWEKFDLITTALMLPDIDGLDLCRRIRKTDTHHYTPIIVVSSDADQRLLREGFAAGVTDYFDKSLGYQAFVTFVQEFTQRNSGLVGRILYVEDSPTAAEVMRRIMEKHGLQVVHVISAEQALELIEQTAPGGSHDQDPFDIIVTDFFLKGAMTGGDLLHAIRARFHYSQQEMPVLVVTVADDDRKQADVFHAGANDFVTKPIVEEILMARIRSLLLIKQQYNALKRQSEAMCWLASTDSLTGTRSKRYLLDHGEGFLTDPASQPVRAMLLDIDHFKNINDQHGHITGDHILAAIGDLLNHSFRDAMVVRFGGEEFCVLLRRCTKRDAEAKAEVLRRKMEELNPEGVPITISIGMAALEDHPGADLTTLLSLADKALYAAKQAGRNRVISR